MATSRMNNINNISPAQHQRQYEHNAGAFSNLFSGANADMRAHAAAMEQQRLRDQERERRERGPPPASRAALRNIPIVKVARHDLVEETNRSCSVCLDDFELGELAVKLPCAHIFHRECVWEWLELHCTCPVCRFELETDDSKYEKERKQRMRGRRPRYRRRELEAMSIPQIRNLARGQNVDIADCLEKGEVVRRIMDSGTVDIVETEIPEYDMGDVKQMSARQLRALMLEVGIDTDDCLEKRDLLDRVLGSRLVNLSDRTSSSPPLPSLPLPAPAPAVRSTPSGGNNGVGRGGFSAGWQGSTAGSTASSAFSSRPSPSSSARPIPSPAARPAWSPAAPPTSYRPFPSHAARPAWSPAAASAPPTSARPYPSAVPRSVPVPVPPPAPAPAPAPSQRRSWWRGIGGMGNNNGRSTASASARPATQPLPRQRERSRDPSTALSEMSVKELRAIMNRLGVSISGCIEKRDMVERIRRSGRYP